MGTKVGEYTINWSNASVRWTCTCPDFKFRRSKTRNEICKHIGQFLEDSKCKTPEDNRYKPRIVFEKVCSDVEDLLDTFQHQACGSWRRNAPFIKDLDFVVLCSKSEDLKELEERVRLVGYVIYGKDKRITWTYQDVQVDFRICDNVEQWGSMILYFTGSKANNIYMRKVAISYGMSLSEYGLTRDGVVIASKTEKEIYEALKLEYKEPWSR